MISRHAKGARSFRYRTYRIGLTFVPQFHRVSLRKLSDLQVFTSYSGPRLTDRGILSKMLLTPPVLDLYAKPLFVFQCASYAPPPVAAFVEATNSFDLEGLMVTFADDALVNDQLRDYWGKAAIRAWAEREIIGERLTIVVTEVVKHYDNFIVTADIDGTFDKRGLPDPLVLAFYFTPHDDLIIQLIILRNRRDV
jgi:hypothetical protein